LKRAEPVGNISGTLENNQAGLLHLRIAYNDGSKGVLVVSGHLKRWSGAAAIPQWIDTLLVRGANGNRLLFHILSGD
jgi:hypothetical protein